MEDIPEQPEENESQDILVEESYDEPPDESQTESDEESDSEVPWKAMEEEAEENDYGNDEELNRATQNTTRYDRCPLHIYYAFQKILRPENTTWFLHKAFLII
jgi:hypothetical protein